MPSLSTTRIVVTDSMGSLIFDSTKSAQPGTLMLLPEIVESLPGNDVFSWSYNNGVIASRAAVPIMSYGNLTGCVYIMERDTSQGTLMQSLQRNIFTITLFLEIIVVLVSVGTALIFTGKFRQLAGFPCQYMAGYLPCFPMVNPVNATMFLHVKSCHRCHVLTW